MHMALALRQRNSALSFRATALLRLDAASTRIRLTLAACCMLCHAGGFHVLYAAWHNFALAAACAFAHNAQPAVTALYALCCHDDMPLPGGMSRTCHHLRVLISRY